MQTPLEIYSPGTSEYSELGQEIKKILDYLISPQLQENLFPSQIIFFLIFIFFFLSIIYFLFKSDYLEWHFIKFIRNFLFAIFLDSKKIANKKWNKIKKNLEKSNIETQWKIYLLEALDILDKSIKKMGRQETEEVFRARKICEDIIQNPDNPVSKKQAQEVFEIFERFLIDLKIL